MANDAVIRKDYTHHILNRYEAAVELDSWGQVEEATTAYKDACFQVSEVTKEGGVGSLSQMERSALSELSTCLKLRALEIKEDKFFGVGLDGIQSIRTYVSKCLTHPGPFPFDLSGISQNVVLLAGDDASSTHSLSRCSTPSRHPSRSKSNSLPENKLFNPGDTILNIRIERMGFKHAKNFSDPHVVMSIVDANGVFIEQTDDIPVCDNAGAHPKNYAVFDHTVQVSTPMRLLQPDFGFFFEFKHYKPHKKKMSTKAWCFMELDEIGDNKTVALEIYRKPTDFTRKRFNLLSVKPLFLHLHITLQKV